MCEFQKESTDHLAEENEGKGDEEEEFPLTLEEVMERRQLVAKVRAQQSYKQYKARRQNKIKSKKYVLLYFYCPCTECILICLGS